MKGPLIGVTFEGQERLALLRQALAAATATIVPLPPAVDSLDLLGRIDGLVLGGGRDIDPAVYGAERAAESEEPDVVRDAFEIALISRACTIRLPILGVCRGMQMINVFFGGTLRQHVTQPSVHHQRYRREAVSAIHHVTFVPGTRLSRLAERPSALVNSRHHQSVDVVGRGLVVAAVSDDGVIEAIEADGAAFVCGVQWHPEDRQMSHAVDRQLFNAFVAAAARSPLAGSAA